MRISIIGNTALISMVLTIVTPTSLYHSELKSVYCPVIYSLRIGMLVSVKFAFTSNNNKAVLKNYVTKTPILIDLV
jgi:hypothetical protein